MSTLKIVSILIVLFSSIDARGVHAQPHNQTSWAKRVKRGKEVTTTLQFYFHNILSSPSPTAVRIARGPHTDNSSSLFGALVMIDDPLTVGPVLGSKIVGRARGMFGSAGMDEFSFIMAVSYLFTDGIYNGSSFSLLSINEVMRPVREMSIVGGTGFFRLARGYALARTVSVDAKSYDIVGYNVTIVTYDYSGHKHGIVVT